MPHAVLDKKIDLEKFATHFEEIQFKESRIIKIQNILVDKMKRMALLPTIVIDEKNQQFLIEISTREGKTTVRLYPGTDPEKTPGVKKSMGLVVQKIQEIFKDTKVTKTNIEEFLVTTRPANLDLV